MDSEQARTILSAYRPDQDDAESDPLIAEAFAQMENDPALADWFATAHLADPSLSDALGSITPPANLQEEILSARKVAAFPLSRFVWLAAAAALVLALGASIYGLAQPRLPFSDLVAQVPGLTLKHGHAIEASVAEMGKLRQWLAANHGAADFAIPPGLQNAKGVACEIISMDGAKVSILCFNMGRGRVAHLYIVDRSLLSQPPPAGQPVFAQQDSIASASWSDAKYSYVLAEPGDSASIRALL